MQVKTTYIADDGREFDDEQECYEYEADLAREAIQDSVFFFNDTGNRLPLTREGMSEAYFVVSKSADASRQASELFEGYNNPFDITCNTGIWYYDDNWRSADDLFDLMDTIKKIQAQMQ